MVHLNHKPKVNPKILIRCNKADSFEQAARVKFNDNMMTRKMTVNKCGRLYLNGRLYQNGAFGDRIKKAWGKVKNFGKKAWEKVGKPVRNIIKKISDSDIAQKIINKIPYGNYINDAIDIVDSTLDTVENVGRTGKQLYETGKNIVKKKDINNDDLQSINNDIQTVKDQTKALYEKYKSKMSPQEKQQAQEAAGRLNLDLLRKLNKLPRKRVMKSMPYSIFLDPNKKARQTIKAKFRDENSPKTLDNTGGRLFLSGKCSGIVLEDANLMRNSDYLTNHGGTMKKSGNLSLVEPESGNLYPSSKKLSTNAQKLYNELFG